MKICYGLCLLTIFVENIVVLSHEPRINVAAFSCALVILSGKITLKFNISSVVYKMVYCAAFDCNNDSRITTGISFYRFPKDPSLRDQWLAKISRADLVITKNSRLCSEHFTPDCFKRDLQAELLGSKKKMHLKDDAVPSIFSHRPVPKKPRLSSENRALVKARQEVRVYNVQKMFN